MTASQSNSCWVYRPSVKTKCAGVPQLLETQLYRKAHYTTTMEKLGWTFLHHGYHHGIILTCNGEVHSVGPNEDGELGIGNTGRTQAPYHRALLPEPVAAVCCGRFTTYAISKDKKKVYSWGNPNDGRLGRSGDHCIPDVVQGLPDGETFIHIEAGMVCGMVLTGSGDVYGWGSHDKGQLGIGKADPCQEIAVKVPQLSGVGVRRIALGTEMGLAETRKDILAWGNFPRSGGASYGPEPKPLHAADAGIRFPLEALKAGGELAAIIDADCQLWLWGRLRLTEAIVTATRVALPGGERVMHVGCGQGIVIALTDSYQLYDCSHPDACVNIRATYPHLPIDPGLTVFGGSCNTWVSFAPLRTVVLAVHGRPLGHTELAMPLSELGVAAETRVQLLAPPPEEMQPAAEGTLQLWVDASMCGVPELACVEIDPDSTAGGLAAAAARQLGLQFARQQSQWRPPVQSAPADSSGTPARKEPEAKQQEQPQQPGSEKSKKSGCCTVL